MLEIIIPVTLPPVSKRLLPAAALAAMIAASLFSRFPHPTPDTGDARRAELRKFAEIVRQQTPPRATILFILPQSEDDGGLTNHRLRYLLPGRFVKTNLDRGTAPELHKPDYVATWPAGTLVKQ